MSQIDPPEGDPENPPPAEGEGGGTGGEAGDRVQLLEAELPEAGADDDPGEWGTSIAVVEVDRESDAWAFLEPFDGSQPDTGPQIAIARVELQPTTTEVIA